MQAREPLKRAFRLLPWLFGATVAVVLALVLLKAQLSQGWPAWLRAAVVLCVGLAIAAVVQFLLVPRLRARVLTAGHVGEVSQHFTRTSLVRVSTAWVVHTHPLRSSLHSGLNSAGKCSAVLQGLADVSS